MSKNNNRRVDELFNDTLVFVTSENAYAIPAKPIYVYNYGVNV